MSAHPIFDKNNERLFEIPKIQTVSICYCCSHPLFYKYKIYGKYKEYECHNVVPCKCFAFEAEGNNHSEYNARNSLLYHFQLHKRVGTAIDVRTYAVGGDEE